MLFFNRRYSLLVAALLVVACYILFVKNVFNDDSWAACSRFSEFDLPNDGATSTLYQSIIVAPQNKRQFGIKTAIKF